MLFFPQRAYKLLDLYGHLKELGHPQYIQPLVNKFMKCSTTRVEADHRVCFTCLCFIITHVHVGSIVYRLFQACCPSHNTNIAELLTHNRYTISYSTWTITELLI